MENEKLVQELRLHFENYLKEQENEREILRQKMQEVINFMLKKEG
jgi:hypothetical protein